jgi:peptide/nickel transport system substrate-binding protein
MDNGPRDPVGASDARAMDRREFLRNAAALTGGAVAGLSGARGTAYGQARPKEVVLAEGTALKTLNPYRSISTPERHFISQIFQRLVKIDHQGKIIGELAESWEVTDGGKLWTFRLKKGVKFSNGEPFNAEAAKFAFGVITDKAYGHIFAAQFSGITRVEAADEYTLKLHTEKPFAPLLINLHNNSAAMVPPRHFRDAKEDFSFKPVGTGPYMLKSWEGDTAVLVRNPHWSGPQPWADSLKYLTIPEDQARVAALERGEVDIAVKLPTHDIARIRANPNVDVQVFPSIYTISFEVNVLKKPFSDRRVRHALMHAIDRPAIIRGILQGFAQPAASPVGPGVPSRRSFEPWPYDPKKARALLTEAGYPNGFSMTVWSPHGRYLKDAEVSEAVVSYLKDVGIDASLKIWEWSPYVDAALAKPSPTKPMDIAMLGRATMGADFWMYRLWHSKSSGNITGYNNPRVDELLDAGRQTFAPVEADRIYGEAQEIIFRQDVPFIFLHHQSQVLGVRKGLTGLYAYPEEFLDLFGVRKA